MLNTAIKRIVIVSILFGFLFGQIVVTPAVLAGDTAAQTTSSTGGAAGGSSGASQTITDGAQAAGIGLAQCTISTLLASILTNAIVSVVGAAFSTLLTGTGVKVPIENQNNDIREHGLTVAGTSVPVLPGLNAIAYCLINTIIAYIADATIAWIRSGFKGNPVFVDDPELFFQSLADYELTNLLNAMTDERLCQPFNLQIKLALLKETTRSYSNTSRCTLGSALNNLQNVGYDSVSWNTMTQNPNNNPYGAYFEATKYLNANIARKQNTFTLELGWSKGFLSFPDPEDPTGRKRLSPGALIEQQLAKRLGASEERLILAEKFDQVVTELVNQLVKIALNEVFEGAQSGTPNYDVYKQYYGGDGGSTVPRPLLMNQGTTNSGGNLNSNPADGPDSSLFPNPVNGLQ